MSPDETRLIDQLREGQEQAFEYIFRLYYRPLTLFAVKYLGDLEEAKEVVQEFFIRLWSKHQTVEIRLSLKTYLYQGVRNACLNFIEANRVKQRRLREYENPQHSHANALEDIVMAEQEDKLISAINALPDKCRQIFLMSRMEKMSNQAIADRLRLSIRTVETQISIALRRLRGFFAPVLLFAIYCMA
jgi:RNA polymerase sigma-70 factor, ECF subfamily